MNNNVASVAGVAANNRARRAWVGFAFLGATVNIFFYFKPTHLKHTTSAFLMHTHTASPLSRLFLMKFLFPLSHVNLSFSADYMETLSNFQLNRPLVSAQNSQIFFIFFPLPHLKTRILCLRHVCGLYIGLYRATRTWEGTWMHLCADGQLLGLSGPLPRWILILSIHQHKLTI